MNVRTPRTQRALTAFVVSIACQASTYGAAPAPPINLAVVVDGMTVTLSWTRAGVGDAATSFVLEAGTSPGASNVFAGNVGNTTTLVASAPAGTYFVRVRAQNADGTSGASNEAAVIIGAAGPCGTPLPPAGVNASVTGTNVTVRWNAAIGASSYLLDAGSAPGLANLFSGDLGNVTSLSAIVGPGTYYVRLRARNACGLSAASTEAVIAVGSPALIGSTTDPAGDIGTGSPDLISAIVAVAAGNLEITVQFAVGTFNRTPITTAPGGTVVHVGVDLDNDANTGNRGSDSTCVADNGIIGTEYSIVFGPGEDGGLRGRLLRFVGPSCNQFVFSAFTAPGSVTLGDDSARIVVPLSLLNNDDGRLAFKVSATRALGGGSVTASLDRMPNSGLPAGLVSTP